MFDLYKKSYLLLAIVGLLALSTYGVAQTTYGSVRGLVTDVQGAAIAHASVVLTEESTHLVRNAETTGAGEYFFSSVAPGHYNIVIDMQGFKKLQRGGILVELGAIATVDVSLQLGSTSETIEVTTSEPLISTATASGGQSIDEQKLQTLPNL